MRMITRLLVWVARGLMFRSWRPGRAVLSRLAAEGKHEEAWARLKNMLAMAAMRRVARKKRGKFVTGLARKMARKHISADTNRKYRDLA